MANPRKKAGMKMKVASIRKKSPTPFGISASNAAPNGQSMQKMMINITETKARNSVVHFSLANFAESFIE